jgi:hypothetical protein
LSPAQPSAPTTNQALLLLTGQGYKTFLPLIHE